MEDFRQLTRIAEMYGHRPQELDQDGAGFERPGRNFALRRVLLSVTVVLLGLAAWWIY